jgi:hypothetical protein
VEHRTKTDKLVEDSKEHEVLFAKRLFQHLTSKHEVEKLRKTFGFRDLVQQMRGTGIDAPGLVADWEPSCLFDAQQRWTRQPGKNGDKQPIYFNKTVQALDRHRIGKLKQYAGCHVWTKRKHPVAERVLGAMKIEVAPQSAHRLLQFLGLVDEHHNYGLAKHSLALDFTEPELAAVKSWSQKPAEDRDAQRRQDLSSLRAYTIDSADTLDVDDAVSVEGDAPNADGSEWVLVHIADVDRIVHPDSDLHAMGSGRISSLYLPEKTYPMLPPLVSHSSLSGQTCSITPGRDNPVLTFRMRIGLCGSVLEYDIFPSSISTVRRCTYDQVTKLLHTTKDSSLEAGGESFAGVDFPPGFFGDVDASLRECSAKMGGGNHAGVPLTANGVSVNMAVKDADRGNPLKGASKGPQAPFAPEEQADMSRLAQVMRRRQNYRRRNGAITMQVRPVPPCRPVSSLPLPL